MLADIIWLLNVRRARAWRRQLSFSGRLMFDKAIRPKISNEPGSCIDYPDALYHIKTRDLARAMQLTSKHEGA